MSIMKFNVGNNHSIYIIVGVLAILALVKYVRNNSNRSNEAFISEAYAAASGKPYCGYNSSNGCCGLPADGGNCNPNSLNFASLGTNNPCPGCYSQPNGGRHHCCPDRPPFNGGGPCVCSGKGYGGKGGGGGSSSSTTAPSTPTVVDTSTPASSGGGCPVKSFLGISE